MSVTGMLRPSSRSSYFLFLVALRLFLVCARSLAATLFSAFVALGVLSTFDAFDATFLLVATARVLQSVKS
jgi:hypothetical protein